MKKIMKKISFVLKKIFGYGIMACLFSGALMFFGYVVAMITGGNTATEICSFIYKSALPIVIKSSTVLVLIGLLAMYLNGETALSANKKTQKSPK